MQIVYNDHVGASTTNTYVTKIEIFRLYGNGVNIHKPNEQAGRSGIHVFMSIVALLQYPKEYSL